MLLPDHEIRYLATKGMIDPFLPALAHAGVSHV